jgi:hypothetical protein
VSDLEPGVWVALAFIHRERPATAVELTEYARALLSVDRVVDRERPSLAVPGHGPLLEPASLEVCVLEDGTLLMRGKPAKAADRAPAQALDIWRAWLRFLSWPTWRPTTLPVRRRDPLSGPLSGGAESTDWVITESIADTHGVYPAAFVAEAADATTVRELLSLLEKGPLPQGMPEMPSLPPAAELAPITSPLRAAPPPRTAVERMAVQRVLAAIAPSPEAALREARLPRRGALGGEAAPAEP